MSCMRASWVTLLAALALAGCASSGNGSAGGESAGGSAAVANDGRCHADGAQFAVGKQASPALLEQARTGSGSQIARILKPRDVMTLEYRSDRVNLNADDSGKVTRVNCG
ncbi:I78 family peptidase inhibitor [Pseudomonas sp. TE3610]